MTTLNESATGGVINPSCELAVLEGPPVPVKNSASTEVKLPSGRKKVDYEAPLLAAGSSLIDDVVHDLTYLVLADPSSASSKAEKAKKLGIAVISESTLQGLLSPIT